MWRLRNVALVCFSALNVPLALAGQSPDRLVRKMRNPGLTLSISMSSSTTGVGEDTQIHVALAKESEQEVRPYFYGLPISALHFSVWNANGEHLGCDPPEVLQAGALPQMRALPAGKTMDFVASLKTWQCPNLPVGRYSVQAFWDLDDLDQQIQSSIPVRIPSNVLSFAIATPNARENSLPPLSAEAKTHSEIADAEDLIHLFASSRDASDLDKAVVAVKRASLENPTYPAQHDLHQIEAANAPIDPHLVALWLKLYAALDTTETVLLRDRKLPSTKVFPPGENGKASPYAGPVSPSQIKDPVAREQYEVAIAENERRRIASINLSQIQSIRIDLSSFFWLWAGGLYEDSPKASASIVKEATLFGCSQSRADWIGAMVVGKRGTFAPPEPQLSAPSLHLQEGSAPTAADDIATSVRACDSGDGAKCAVAGFAYLRGKGVPRDAAESLLLFSKGCDLGDAQACDGAGGAYPFGSQERLKYEVRACDSGYARECLSLASDYERKKDPPRARELRQEACDKDPRWACAEAGEEYTGQRLASKDMVFSEHLFQQGCDHNDPVSCADLAELYVKGDGIPVAPTKALDLYRKTCNLEDPNPAAGLNRGFGVGKACDRLARMYVSGDIVAKDDSMAFQFYRRACEHRRSCDQAGNMADEGRGTERDPALAQRLLAISCKDGAVSSCERAGLLVLELHPDEGEQAVGLYRQGCETIDFPGDGHACLRLGEARLIGLSAKKDLPGAINAFSLACRYGVSAGCDEKRLACAQVVGSTSDAILTRLCASE